MFTCMKCDSQMLSNSFICKRCEYWIGKENHKTNKRRLVTEQRDFVRGSSESPNKGSENSPYWDYTQMHYWNKVRDCEDEPEDMYEHAQSNPDTLAHKEIKRRIGSKCVFCDSKVLISQEGIDTHAHDSCWAVFKGQMLKEDN